MNKVGIFFTVLLLLHVNDNVMAASRPQALARTETIEIPTDMLPPPSAEEVVPKHPFFSETTTGKEVFEYVLELEERVKVLEDKVRLLEEGKNK